MRPLNFARPLLNSSVLKLPFGKKITATLDPGFLAQCFRAFLMLFAVPFSAPAISKGRPSHPPLTIPMPIDIVVFSFKNDRMTTYETCSLYSLFIPSFIAIKTMVTVSCFNTTTRLMILYIFIRWVIKEAIVFSLILTSIYCTYQTARLT